jgi:hypothetical protein
MSKHNRVRKRLWKLGLHKRQVGRKLSNREIHERVKAMQGASR